jgi:PP-loop superfamily ATP-utilizing enzyme
LDRVHFELRVLGFKYIALDLAGYRIGSLDEFL